MRGIGRPAPYETRPVPCPTPWVGPVPSRFRGTVGRYYFVGKSLRLKHPSALRTGLRRVLPAVVACLGLALPSYPHTRPHPGVNRAGLDRLLAVSRLGGHLLIGLGWSWPRRWLEWTWSSPFRAVLRGRPFAFVWLATQAPCCEAYAVKAASEGLACRQPCSRYASTMSRQGVVLAIR